MESISTRSDDNECERVAMQYLGKGSKVEVSCSEDGFKGSYFAATIVEVPQKTPWPSNKMHKDSLVVEYENLVTDDGSKPLRELVDLSSIRPSPPSKGNGEPSFEINDVVDAYYSDGWWVGVIDRVLGCREESKRYRVLFNDPRHCMEFDRSLLRPHLDWVGGQWVPPPKQERGHALSNMEKSENVAFDSSMTVEKRDGVIRGQCSPYLRKNKLESDSCTDKTSLHVVSSSKRRPEKLTPRGCSKKLKVGRGYQPVDKSRTMPIEMENEATFSVCGAQGTGHSKQVAVDSQPKAKTERALELMQHASGGISIPKKKRGWRSKCIGKESYKDGGATVDLLVIDYASITLKNVESTAVGTLQFDNTLEHTCKIGNEDGGSSGEIVVKDSASNKVELYLIGEEDSTTAGASQRQHSGDICSGDAITEKEIVKDCASTEAEIKLEYTAEEASQCKNQHSGKECNDGVGDAPDKIAANDCTAQDKLPTSGEVECTIVMASECENRVEYPGCQEVTAQKLNEVSSMDCAGKDVEMAAVESSTNGQLHMWSDGPYSTPDNSIKLSREATIEAVSVSVVDVNQRLPFVKRSPVWEVIESLEVFKKTPQKPHFHPLHNEAEAFREGLAVANLVTFSNLVDMISDLKYEDPKNKFDSILEPLSELEKHGFDVEPLQKRLNELQSIKACTEQLEVEFKATESQVMDKTHEKTSMEGAIDELAKNLQDLKDDFAKKLKDLEERMVKLHSMKHDKDSEIEKLRSNLDIISGRIQVAKCKFQALATTS